MSLINQRGRLNNSLFRQTLTLKRLKGEHSAEGFNAIYSNPENIIAIAIPTTPNDMQLMPEMERFLPSMKFFTGVPLSIGDLVHFRNHDYRIIKTGDWGDYGYYNNIGVRHSATAKVDSEGFEIT
ncbi:hypothetical protein ACFGWK_10830 [Pasteurella multocida]